MDQRELETRLRALQKAVGEKDSAENVISILESLKKETSPTEDLLRVCLSSAHARKQTSWNTLAADTDVRRPRKPE